MSVDAACTACCCDVPPPVCCFPDASKPLEFNFSYRWSVYAGTTEVSMTLISGQVSTTMTRYGVGIPPNRSIGMASACGDCRLNSAVPKQNLGRINELEAEQVSHLFVTTIPPSVFSVCLSVSPSVCLSVCRPSLPRRQRLTRCAGARAWSCPRRRRQRRRSSRPFCRFGPTMPSLARSSLAHLAWQCQPGQQPRLVGLTPSWTTTKTTTNREPRRSEAARSRRPRRRGETPARRGRASR